MLLKWRVQVPSLYGLSCMDHVLLSAVPLSQQHAHVLEHSPAPHVQW